MKLVVGLGNYGKEFDNTRHNIGFMAIDYIVRHYNIELNKKNMDGLYATTVINGEKYIFLKPLKFMNLSGEVIKTYIDFYKINISDILVIHDDLDMDIGKIRLKYRGSSGGHNGLKNIELNLKTNNYNRIKIGISNNKQIFTGDYVLGKFTDDEKKVIDVSLENLLSIFVDYSNNISFDKLMNRYN